MGAFVCKCEILALDVEDADFPALHGNKLVVPGATSPTVATT